MLSTYLFVYRSRFWHIWS